MDNQSVTIKKSDYRNSITINMRDHQPSWKRPLADSMLGGAFLEVDYDPRPINNSLSFDMSEWYYPIGGREISKRTMLTLNEDCARALFKVLEEKFGKGAE